LCLYAFAKKIQSQTVIREKLLKALLYEKVAHKTLMKLTLDSALSLCGILVPCLLENECTLAREVLWWEISI